MLVSDGADVDLDLTLDLDLINNFSNSAVKDIMGQKRSKIDLRCYVR